MTSELGLFVLMSLEAVCLTVTLICLIGTCASVPTTPSPTEAKACAVYLLKQAGYSHRTLPYSTSSRTLHIGTLTPPALWQEREFSLHIQLKDYSPIVVYVNGNRLSVRLDGNLLASETLHHPTPGCAADVSKPRVAEKEAAARDVRQSIATGRDRHPIGGRDVREEGASLRPNHQAPPDYVSSFGNISGNFTTSLGHPRDGSGNKGGETGDWWSLTVQFTDQLVLVRRFGSLSASAVGRLPIRPSAHFAAEAFVSSQNAMAITFDCVSGCPVFTAALEGVSFPILQLGPPVLLFLCSEGATDDNKLYTIDIQTGQCPSNDSTTAAGFERQRRPSFSFALSTGRGDSNPQCVNISFKRPHVMPSLAPLQNVSMNRSALHQGEVCSQFKISLEQTAETVGILVSVTPDRASARHSVSVTLQGEVTPNMVVYFTPLSQTRLRFTLNCLPDPHMVSSAPVAGGASGCSGAGLAWSIATVALLAVALLAAALIVFVRPNCRYRWEELDDDSEEDRSHFVVPVPEDDLSQLSDDGSSVAELRPPVGRGGAIKNGGQMALTVPVLVFSTLREAEEVSEPGSPPPPREQSTSSDDGLKCVSGLTVDTTLEVDTHQ